jgi:hypothetical protein
VLSKKSRIWRPRHKLALAGGVTAGSTQARASSSFKTGMQAAVSQILAPKKLVSPMNRTWACALQIRQPLIRRVLRQLDSFRVVRSKDSLSCWSCFHCSLFSVLIHSLQFHVSTAASSTPSPGLPFFPPYPRLPKQRPATPRLSHFSFTGAKPFFILTKHISPHVPHYSRTCPFIAFITLLLNATIWKYFSFGEMQVVGRPGTAACPHAQAHFVIRWCMITI